MTEILSLKPEDAKRLHPEALSWFDDQRATIEREVPLEELSDEDLNAFLSDAEKWDFLSCMKEITESLAKCINVPETSTDAVSDAIISLTVLRFQVGSLSPMHTIKSLLKTVYKRKVEKEEEEQKRRQEEARRRKEEAEAERSKKEADERWWAAYRALNIPCTDASKYLKPEEEHEFVESILGAVDAYLDNGESYSDDGRAGAYLSWINKINKSKEEERQQIATKVAAIGFNDSLIKHIAGLRSKLINRPPDLQNYFTAKIQDRRYTGHNFDYILNEEQERILDTTLVKVANDKLKLIVPPDLLEFIEIPSIYYRRYFPLPSISYSCPGIPCLVFSFDTFAATYAEVLLRPKAKRFGSCSLDLPAKKEGNVLVPLDKPELLGYFQILLTPDELGGHIFWQTIPLALLSWLFNGGTRPSGIMISQTSDDSIGYKIKKFEGEINIPDKFADYLRCTGSIDNMVDMGILTRKTATIARNESGELRVEQQALLPEEKGRESKKARAFLLFSQGKGPSSPELKALGLHKSTRFKYYKQYMTTHKS